MRGIGGAKDSLELRRGDTVVVVKGDLVNLMVCTPSQTRAPGPLFRAGKLTLSTGSCTTRGVSKL